MDTQYHVNALKDSNRKNWISGCVIYEKSNIKINRINLN